MQNYAIITCERILMNLILEKRFIMNDDKADKIYWHTCFYVLLEMLFSKYNKNLSYKNEYPLNKEPLRMDVLIIKKNKNINKEWDS